MGMEGLPENQKNNILEEMERVGKKRDAWGPLSLTKEDHHGMGSTPSDKLEENPGKAEVELMSDEEILEWLNGFKNQIEKFSGDTSGSTFIESYLPQIIKDQEATLRYLKDIGRLPKEFEE